MGSKFSRFTLNSTFFYSLHKTREILDHRPAAAVALSRVQRSFSLSRYIRLRWCMRTTALCSSPLLPHRQVQLSSSKPAHKAAFQTYMDTFLCVFIPLLFLLWTNQFCTSHQLPCFRPIFYGALRFSFSLCFSPIFHLFTYKQAWTYTH